MLCKLLSTTWPSCRYNILSVVFRASHKLSEHCFGLAIQRVYDKPVWHMTAVQLLWNRRKYYSNHFCQCQNMFGYIFSIFKWKIRRLFIYISCWLVTTVQNSACLCIRYKRGRKYILLNIWQQITDNNDIYYKSHTKIFSLLILLR